VALITMREALNQALKDPAWLGLAKEGYVFTAVMFFACCFAMSSYGRSVERREVFSLRGQTLPFIRLGRVFNHKERAGLESHFVVVVGLMGVSLVALSFLTAWLVWTSAYVGVALVRAGVRRVRRGERSGTTAEQGMGGVRESRDA
jgi:ABC-type amino acid transport system permease subunit